MTKKDDTVGLTEVLTMFPGQYVLRLSKGSLEVRVIMGDLLLRGEGMVAPQVSRFVVPVACYVEITKSPDCDYVVTAVPATEEVDRRRQVLPMPASKTMEEQVASWVRKELSRSRNDEYDTIEEADDIEPDESEEDVTKYTVMESLSDYVEPEPPLAKPAKPIKSSTAPADSETGGHDNEDA